MRSQPVSDQLTNVFLAFDAQDVPTLVASVLTTFNHASETHR